MIKVAFILELGGTDWLGGISYYRNLFSAICDLPNRRIDPVLICSSQNETELRARFSNVPLLHLPLLDVGGALRKGRQAMRAIFGRDVLLERALASRNVAVLSHSSYLGRRASVASIVWIPDFQELTFPEFFSQKMLAARRRNVERACRFSSTVLLSSEAALADLKRIGARGAYTAVLPFVANVPRDLELLRVDELRKKYELPAGFFHIPNQFWVHKNHIVVLRALASLRKSGWQFPVVATGNTSDPRQPDHFRSLMTTARELGVDDLFVPLGVVPYQDLMSLMRHAIAIVNPSKFEGWSTTVEEAKSMGKHVILSDIAVHKEQMPNRRAFFLPDDSEMLARKLSEAASQWEPNRELRYVEQAAAHLKERRETFARRYEDIVLAALTRRGFAEEPVAEHRRSSKGRA
jgi:glycosyltransferase involved in cell wall biosynthesis